MRYFISILFVSLQFLVTAQVSTFNQYNGSLSGINPAYISNIEKDQIALISRNQWANNKLGSFTSEASFNKFFPVINSSFGLISNYSINHQDSYNTLSSGMQYGYRLLFLEKYYWCLGVGINHERTEMDVNNFYYIYEPKKSYPSIPAEIIKSESLKSSFGLIFYDFETKQYVGVSLRNQPLSELSSETKILKQSPTFSVQAMKQLNISRESMLFIFLNFEQVGKINYQLKDSSAITLQKAYSYMMIQTNLYIHNVAIFGVGYKYFPNNYGSLFYRITAIIGKEKRLTIGFSFDTKAYIQNDNIQFNPSYELYIKHKLFNN